ncbi:FGGY-family carbohydrate kinase [Ulvibacterium sp.]|uniref:FGGY-family carbohydrate kinase n=1 Tax=Ulvibacterium sp. TaxID=2665914 RepID=UPI003BA92CB8
MKKKVTAVFDIGKTNKKFFLFDKNYQEVYREYIRLEEIVDEDGYPTEDIEALVRWAKEVFDKMLDAPYYDIEALNFSCYGATLVHIDENGKVLTPVYNYTKPLPKEIYASFYDQYGPEDELSRVTGSLQLGMLNTGMQMYWLKYTRPEAFKRIKYSLHLPQYLSYVFTGVPVSEYTSIGCHTMLWDYGKKDYHPWVYQEGIDKKFPPIAAAEKIIDVKYKGKMLGMGIGIHDSSSALLPYVRSVKKKFILVSTGTWSIAMNPLSDQLLTKDDIRNNCINYMRIDGKPVKSARLFLGNEYRIQIAKLSKYFKVPDDYHKKVRFDQDTYFEIIKDFEHLFRWESFSDKNMPERTQIPFHKFEHAYHQLMVELVLLQTKSIEIASAGDKVEKLFVDGGFSDNDVYIQLLSHYQRNVQLMTTDSSLGSALGAAIVISGSKLEPKFLKENYATKRHVPFS